jgi:DNA-binding FadR family transcriptional regulator
MEVKLRGPALSQAIRDHIKRYIIENNLGPGAPLPPEGHLADELGVGRSSVREAVKALQSLGIVEVRHGDGLYVREWNFDPILETLNYGFRFDKSAIIELFQIRMWLEAAIIGDAVKQISDDEIAELESIMEQWKQRVQANEPDSDLDERFHLTLYGVLGNQTMLKLIEVFWIAFDNLDSQEIKAHDPQEVLVSHLHLLEAVVDREPALARTRLIASFDDLRRRLSLPKASVRS